MKIEESLLPLREKYPSPFYSVELEINRRIEQLKSSLRIIFAIILLISLIIPSNLIFGNGIMEMAIKVAIVILLYKFSSFCGEKLIGNVTEKRFYRICNSIFNSKLGKMLLRVEEVQANNLSEGLESAEAELSNILDDPDGFIEKRRQKIEIEVKKLEANKRYLQDGLIELEDKHNQQVIIAGVKESLEVSISRLKEQLGLLQNTQEFLRRLDDRRAAKNKKEAK